MRIFAWADLRKQNSDIMNFFLSLLLFFSKRKKEVLSIPFRGNAIFTGVYFTCVSLEIFALESLFIPMQLPF